MFHSPDKITDLQPNEVFVFGSNLKGTHGAGAAKQALKWGAHWGIGTGLHGQTYAIPTKSWSYKVTLPIDAIERHVDAFLDFAHEHPELTFLVTQIGCGLAGYTPEQMAPLFADALRLPNVLLPKVFIDIITQQT